MREGEEREKEESEGNYPPRDGKFFARDKGRETKRERNAGERRRRRRGEEGRRERERSDFSLSREEETREYRETGERRCQREGEVISFSLFSLINFS